MTQKYFLKLRSNIVLNGDVDLAEREVKSFFSHVERVDEPETVEKIIGLPIPNILSNTRKNGCVGFLVSGSRKTLEELILVLNFTQEIWSKSTCKEVKSLSKFEWAYALDVHGAVFLCAMPFMTCGELLSQSKVKTPTKEDVRTLTAFLAGATSSSGKVMKAPTTGGTSTQHVHSLHKYKAKFFPRLIRSFLVEHLDRLPRNKDGKIKLLDPFVGSGTALIEASLLGIDSDGVDIDKLSCAISQAKLDILNISPEQVITTSDKLDKAVSQVNITKNPYHFPSRIAKKFERWETQDEQQGYEATITKWKNAIDSLKDKATRHLFAICLSDALTRKFVIRMMGTGVGRFALEIAKTSLDSLMAYNFKALIHSTYVAKTIIESYEVNLGKAEVHHGTAVKLPFNDNTFSIIITSPPYLPASSGREDYLVGKSISNIALNLMTDEEIEEAETNTVGSMKWSVEHGDGLPKAVYELYNWLSNDPLRAIKAKPTLAYYVSLKKALEENLRVLLPGGLAVYVIGKESVFYRFSDREVLFKVECDKIFAELSLTCGFVIDEIINVELDKKNKNARPRSLDSYYETVFILRKPDYPIADVCCQLYPIT